MEQTRTRIPVNNISSEEKLLDYVQVQTDKFAQYTKLNNGKGAPGYWELTQAIMDYSSVQSALISSDVLAKVELQKKQDAFDDWYADMYTMIRTRENPRDISAQKWISSKEIEMILRSEFKTEYNRLNQEVKYAEMKVAYLRRMLDLWDNYKFNLNRLCRNEDMQSQLSGKFFRDDKGTPEEFETTEF